MVSMTNWIAQVKMECVLAQSLILEGKTPVIVTYSTCRWAQRYFRAFGIRHVIAFNTIMDALCEPADSAEAERLLSSSPTFASFLSFEWHGIRIGQHVLSTLVRRLKSSAFTFSDPVVHALLAERIPESLRAARAAEQIMHKWQPQTVLFLEKGYTPYGEVFDAAINHGCDVIQYVHGQRRDALVLKRYSPANRRAHPFSFAQKTWERVKALPWSPAQEDAFMEELKVGYEQGTWFNRKFLLEGKRLKTAEEIRGQLGLDPQKKTAVIFSHVLWDATFFFGENLFPDYEQWLIETVRVACENDQVNWIIKVHPDYAWKMKQMGDRAAPRDIQILHKVLGDLPAHIKIVLPNTDISTYSFFQVIDYCITVRGTVGIEAPCFGIPVFTAGTGRYSGLGFTNDSQTREEYLEKLKHIHTFGRLNDAETSLARRHAAMLFQCRPLPFTTFEMTQQRYSNLGRPLDHNITLHAYSIQQLHEAKDIRDFCHWVCRSRDEDYCLIPLSQSSSDVALR